MKNVLIVAAVAAVFGTGCMMDTVDGEDVTTDVDEVGSDEQQITGPGSHVSYSKALVRLDFKQGGRCSAVLVGPNLLVTSAHCVDDKIVGGINNWNNMRYGKVRVRMVYKPTSSEVMCLNEPCWSAGNIQYSTVYAFWDSSYSGTGNWSSDMAILTRLSQADFLVKANDAADPAPRNFNSGDFLRIVKGSLPTREAGWDMRIAGYGTSSDGVGTLAPRAGHVRVNDWNKYSMTAKYQSGLFWASTCQGDSGGPISITPGIGGRTYVGGVIAGFNSNISGSCPEPGDTMAFNRMAPKLWMLNHVRQWIEGESCRLYNTTSLPGNGEYYKCW